MSLLTLTINNLSPALATKAQEVAQIAGALAAAAAAVQSAQGAVTSGNILAPASGYQVVIGSWTYTPQASS